MLDVVVNTSPLQYLHQIGQLDLLHRLYGDLWIPRAVEAELREGTLRGVDLPQLEGLAWLRQRTPAQASLSRLATDLGAGECEVLALGLELPGSLTILDDELGRRHACLLGLRLTGTLGVILKGKQSGFVETVTPLVSRLVALGFRLHPALRREVLTLAGEA